MKTDEPARLELLRGLEQVLGPDRATTLMTYLPDAPEVATRDDVGRLERRMDERFESMQRQIDARFESMQQQIDARYEALRTLLDERYTALQHQIKGGNDSTSSTLHAEMSRLVTSQTRAIVFAVIGAITAQTTVVLLAI